MAQTETTDLNQLFTDVQMNRIFPDGKTFVDCVPKNSIPTILELYTSAKEEKGFDLKKFVLTHFELPVPHSTNYKSDTSKTVEENIEALWAVLTRQPGKKEGTLIALPHPYVVPGGRFGEIYYWDSYFTMLGLKAAGKNDMLENMVRNFSFLIDTIGYIPNGNRSYFIGRSQPPYYSLMIRLLATVNGDQTLLTYLPQLEKEYSFWMKGAAGLNEDIPALHRTVKMKDGEILNRFWDENNSPRPESFREDVELSHTAQQESKQLYRHLRAGAESGWDFSCRWFSDENSFATIHTTHIIPVDLNCLLLHLEETIADAYHLQQNDEAVKRFSLLAQKRKQAIQKYCWNNQEGFFFDYDFVTGEQKKTWTLAGVFPLTFRIASADQAKRVADALDKKFLHPGGLISTLITTGQQWDAPNGWAPLHWMTITGLENYELSSEAKEIAKRWIKLNTDVFKRTGKLMEKYNVVDTHLEAGGGEYEGQDGFGWTNGVLLALQKKYGSQG